MPQITYISDAVISCRLRGIYHAIIDQNRLKAINLIQDMLHTIETAVEVDVDPHILNSVVKHSYKALIHLAMIRYTKAHDHIRTLHYVIETQYM